MAEAKIRAAAKKAAAKAKGDGAKGKAKPNAGESSAKIQTPKGSLKRVPASQSISQALARAAKAPKK